jgi:hypothetical protein
MIGDAFYLSAVVVDYVRDCGCQSMHDIDLADQCLKSSTASTRLDQTRYPRTVLDSGVRNFSFKVMGV